MSVKSIEKGSFIGSDKSSLSLVRTGPIFLLQIFCFLFVSLYFSREHSKITQKTPVLLGSAISYIFHDLIRGLGRDLAKLGDKLHQLEMAMGEFSLQQVRGASSHNSNEKSKHG